MIKEKPTKVKFLRYPQEIRSTWCADDLAGVSTVFGFVRNALVILHPWHNE